MQNKPILGADVLYELAAAASQADDKHKQNSILRLQANDPQWLAILTEEIGEVAHELTYDSDGSLRDELIQVAAVAAAWAQALKHWR